MICELCEEDVIETDIHKLDDMNICEECYWHCVDMDAVRKRK